MCSYLSPGSNWFRAAFANLMLDFLEKTEEEIRMAGKSLWKAGVLGFVLILAGSVSSFSALTPQEGLQKAQEYMGAQDWSRAVDALEDVLILLREKAPLEVENTLLASEIYQFGSYDERASSVFAPNEPILIYAELRNFHTEAVGDGTYAIRINEDFQLLDIDDNLIYERKEFAAVELNFNNPRVTDLFLRNTVNLSGVPSGSYKVKIIITDLPSGKKGDMIVPISIRGMQ